MACAPIFAGYSKQCRINITEKKGVDIHEETWEEILDSHGTVWPDGTGGMGCRKYVSECFYL